MWTSLHGAVHQGHAECVTAMLVHDPPPGLLNMADNDGWTVAHLAAARKDKVRAATSKLNSPQGR